MIKLIGTNSAEKVDPVVKEGVLMVFQRQQKCDLVTVC